MPRTTAAEAARTAVRVRDAATALFAEHGFAAVSLDDVAAAAGVTRGAVYHHYRHKRGVFEAVASALQARVADDVVRAADAAGDDPAAQLLAGCHAFLDSITARASVRVLLIDAPSVIGWEAWRRMDAENSASHLAEALAAAGVSADLVDAATAHLSGAMNEAALWVASHPDARTARSAAHTALNRILAGFVGEVTPPDATATP